MRPNMTMRRKSEKAKRINNLNIRMNFFLVSLNVNPMLSEFVKSYLKLSKLHLVLNLSFNGEHLQPFSLHKN